VVELDESRLNNDEVNLPPGSINGIKPGERIRLEIENFKGTADSPFIFTNCDGQAILSKSSSGETIEVTNSEHLRITGTGSEDLFGIKITDGAHGLRAHQKVNDIEVDHLEVSNVGIALWFVTRPECDGSANRGNYVQKNTRIHHNYVHDIKGEGLYVGGSKWEQGFNNNGCPGEKLQQADLVGVWIYNNLVENAGWDGLQVGGAVEDCEIYNNVIRNYGLEKVTVHQAGIQINPGTVGKIYANLIDTGEGNGIHTLGYDNLIYSNLLMNIGLNGIHVGDRSPLAGKSYRIVNNTILGTEEKALFFNSSESVNNLFMNNFLFDIGDEDIHTKTNNLTVENNIFTSSLDSYPFENGNEYDYTPTLESVLLDSSAVFDRDNITVDFLLRERLVGEKMDIGAFENQDEGE
jgi:hypothetical protein